MLGAKGERRGTAVRLLLMLQHRPQAARLVAIKGVEVAEGKIGSHGQGLRPELPAGRQI